MAQLRLVLRMLALGVTLSAGPVYAESSCSNWLWQEGGWYWRQCVDDNGSQHCYHADDANGSNAYEISCKS